LRASIRRVYMFKKWKRTGCAERKINEFPALAGQANYSI
jgi:hypothetical protein